jgi:alanine racemase
LIEKGRGLFALSDRVHGEGLSSGRPLHAIIDSQAFRHNIQRVTELAPTSEPMLVLKANGYGHGLLEMARAAGERDIAVAVPGELSVLRDAGIGNRVWVLEGVFSPDCLAREALGETVWVVHSLWQLDILREHDGLATYKVCLKIDTGMNRLGLSLAEFSVALKQINKTSSVHFYACMTHFASSDQPDNSFVYHQLDEFKACMAKYEGAGNVLASAANSGGILSYPESHLDIVRPGIMLYGGMPSPVSQAKDFNLKPVMKLRSAVISLNTVKAGEAVGYGGCWQASRDSLIATIAGGYGDGYPRHAQNGTPVAIYDRENDCIIKVPLVGRVSMDMLAIDVTELKNCVIGDPVELWGDYVSADEIALASETISYELFCGVTARVPRYYR